LPIQVWPREPVQRLVSVVQQRGQAEVVLRAQQEPQAQV